MRQMLRPHVGATTSVLYPATALAYWKFDEASGNALDAVGGNTLTAINSPGADDSLFAVPQAVTGSRTFNGSTQSFTRSGDAAAVSHFLGNHTFSTVFRPDTVSGTRTLFGYVTSGETLATNSLLGIRSIGTEINWIWERGAGVNVTATTSGAGLQANTSYLILVAVDDATSGTATDCDVRLYLFEKDVGLVYEQTWVNQYRPEGGTSSNFGVGVDLGVSGNYFDGKIDDMVLWKYPLTRDAAFMLYAQTFGISYDEETIYDTDAAGYHLRVRVADANGTLRDLTNIAHSQDLVVSAQVSDDIDQPGASATVSVVREVDSWSLAHDVETSPLNTLTGSYAALLELNARILIDSAVMPQGMTPSGWDWVPLFEGYISSVDWGGEEIAIQATDKIGPLFDTFIAREPLQIDLIDDNGPYNNLVVDTLSPHGLTSGDRVLIINTTNYNGQWTVVPTTTTQFQTIEFTGGVFASEIDGLIFKDDQRPYGSAGGVPVETVMQQLIDDNVPKLSDVGTTYGYTGGTPKVYTPSSPSFDILPYYQKREPVQTALETLAAMFGWNIKYKWDREVNDFRLTLYSPSRLKSVADYTFTTDEILEVSRASLDAKDIRNVVEVIYSDFANADENNFAPRVSVRRSSTSSITKYGFRLCQIAEASTSQIDTYAEAAALADAVLDDLKEPKADVTIEVPFRRFVDTADLYAFPADGRHWDVQKKFAVVGYSHTFADGAARTTLNLRGQPASMNKGWKNRFVAPGLAPNQPTTPPVPTSAAPNLSPFPGGANVFQDFPNDLRARQLDTVEVHVSQTSGFNPSSSTYNQVSRANRLSVLNLDPAQTHYIRTQFRDRMGNVSRWSDEAAVTPKYMLSIPAARAYRATSDQAIPSKVWTTVQFNAEDYDKRNNFSTATYKFTVPVDGVYQISCHVAIEFGSTGEAAQLRFVKNGVPTVIATGPDMVGESHSKIAHPTLDTAVDLSATDEVFVQVYATVASDLLFAANAADAVNFISIQLVSQD